MKWESTVVVNAHLTFRNTFLVAADIVNEFLERGSTGEFISQASRNVSVYYASDDIALWVSKVFNLKNKVASRRLGHSGPQNLYLKPRNIFSIDCDDVNTKYDKLKGYSNYLYNGNKKPGQVFKHIYNSIKSRRVKVEDIGSRTNTINVLFYLC